MKKLTLILILAALACSSLFTTDAMAGTKKHHKHHKHHHHKKPTA